MEVLLLCYRGEPLRQFELAARPLEIGSGAGCDITVHDAALRERHYLIARKQGTVMIHPVGGRPGAAAKTLPPGDELPLGSWHSLVRLKQVPTRPRSVEGRTEPIESAADTPELGLVIGNGRGARRVALGLEPLTVGSDASCGLRLHDRAVSARHCRLEPSPSGLRVRDLGSRNGTHVDGVAVTLATLGSGSTLRVGRTNLRLIPQGRSQGPRGMVAESELMRGVVDQVEHYARLRWPTLVIGESGAGKEGVARGLHERSVNPEAPFVAINAGGMPASLIESELFGHEKGAFTGASSVRRGVFEQAHGGTLFLDEIGELPLELQSRLLRVIETWQVRRVGAERSLRVDVRLICATHRDLPGMVTAGTFRQDLYYRLAQLVIHVPPLRARPSDIAPLAEHFLAELSREIGPRTLSTCAAARLLSYDWPGNARELRTVIRRAGVACGSRVITRLEIHNVLQQMGTDATLSSIGLQSLLDQHGGNIAAAARTLGIPRSTFRDRLRRREASDSGA